MTVSTTTSVTVILGNGVASVFPFSFKVLDATHLLVRRRIRATGVIDKTYTTAEYTVTGIDTNAGEVTIIAGALAATYDLIISRVVPYTQELDIVNQGGFYPDTAEEQLDAMVMQTQQIAADVARTMKVAVGETLTDLPAASLRASKFPVFNAAGDLTVTSGLGADAALRTDLATAATGTSLIAYPGGGTLQTQFNKVILTPEQFGANGSSATDQNTFMEAMMVAARSVGRARLRFTEGMTYTVTNPFMFGGLRSLEIEGNRAKLMNFRVDPIVGQDSNYQPFRSPVPTLPNGVDLITFGVDQGSGVPIMGATIATAEAGATTLTILSGTLAPGNGWAYGWDRYGVQGFPVVPAYIEPITILTVVGAIATLSQPLTHRYDANAPEYLDNGNPRAGAARVVMLDRTAGTYRPNVWMDSLRIFDLEFIANPGQAGAGNGMPGIGGAKNVYLEGVKAGNGNVSMCDKAVLKRCEFSGDFEIDKMIGELVIEDSKIARLLSGVGCGILRLTGQTRITKEFNAYPYALTEINPEVHINSTTGLDRAVIKQAGYGCAKVIIDRPTLAVTSATIDRLFEAGKFNWTPTTITTTTLGSSRLAWDAGTWAFNMRVGTVFYAGNIPVGVITSMPTVPAGTRLRTVVTSPPSDDGAAAGAVQIGYKLLGGSIAAATVLSVPVLADVEVRAWPVLEGPFARQVQSLLGAELAANGALLSKIKTPSVRETEIEIDQTLAEFIASGNVMKSFGRAFRVGSIDIDVTRPAVDAGAVSLGLFGDKADGTVIGIIAAVDLKTTGRTTLVQSSSSGLTGLGATVLGGTVTITIATPGVVTLASHGLSNNQTVQFRTTGALPTGLTALTTYYARNVAANTFEVSLTSGGASIATSGAQSGVHSIYGLPVDTIIDVRCNDGSRILTEGNRAAWKIIAKGYFV